MPFLFLTMPKRNRTYPTCLNNSLDRFIIIQNHMSTNHSNFFTTLHLVIHGRVQGVFFRDSMRHEAQRLGIRGWVRNTAEGTVEAMVQSEQSAVDKIVQWAQRGPQQAQVDKVEVEVGSGTYKQFEILY